MPRSQGTAVQNSFVRGRITEATGLNFPENAVTDEKNCVFDRSGKVRRRLGIDYETDYEFDTLTETGVTKAFLWEAVGNNGNRTLSVVQIGYKVYFYAVLDSLSSGFKSFSIDLRTYKSSVTVSDTEMSENSASFSYGLGYLFIAHKYCEPMYVKYNEILDSITVTTIEIRVRDFDGLDDGLETNERPSNLTLEHEYNLQNQGWNFPIRSAFFVSDNPIHHWEAGLTAYVKGYPSNADIWWVNKDSNSVMNIFLANSTDMGNSPSSKGHFVYPAFNIRRAVVRSTSEIAAGVAPAGTNSPGTETLIETKTTTLRPQFTQFYAGRVFWAGVLADGFSSKVYYSKVIESERDFGICHMVNDPTAEFLNDLLPTDGGEIIIPEMSEIKQMFVVGDSLLIFATNGVWSISGTTSDSFSADNYKVSKVSDIGCLSSASVVIIDSTPFWWNVDGIYTMMQDQLSVSVKSITRDTIKTFFDTIPPDSKKYAQASWDKLTNTVTWLYRGTQAATLEENFTYDSCLVLNTETGAFYTYEFSGTPKIRGLISVTGEIVRSTQVDVTSGGVVVTSGGADVTSKENQSQQSTSVTKFLTQVGTSWTWSQLNNTGYKDWETYDSAGTNYSSYFSSGYVVRGESHRDFQTNYITFTSDVEESSSFFVSGRWDYAIDQTSNRFTSRQQGYKHDSTRSYTQRKLKIRGSGKVLQYRVESQSGRPFNISGWVTWDTANSQV